MKKIFEIEWADESGSEWMNTDNLLLCINAYCKGNPCKVKEIKYEKETHHAESQ